MPRPKSPPLELSREFIDEPRFWSNVDVQPDNRCWTWKRSKDPFGYAHAHLSGGRATMAHRVSYFLVKGPIPKGLDLDHLCRNRGCVNPMHLEAVDRRTNLLRGIGFAAKYAAQTHCKRGHELTPENTFQWKAKGRRPARICKQCRWLRDGTKRHNRPRKPK